MFKASARKVRISPRKARLVVDLIRGKEVGLAIGILASTNKKASPVVSKVLKSAIANAEHNGGHSDTDSLKVTAAWVDDGATLRRYTAKAFGRGATIRKRTSHIHVVVG